MTLVSDDPSYWPVINSWRIGSYFEVVAFVAVTYDWALTFGQEVELVWRQRWSLMTVLYLSVRYLGMLSAFLSILYAVPTISLTDVECRILYLVWGWTIVVAFPMLCVIMIARLHAMYQRSRRILIFLVITFLAVNISNGVVDVMMMKDISGDELILSGTYQCMIAYAGNALLLNSVNCILGTVWEVLALCLAVRIAVKHFRELRQHSAGGILGDCFMVLMKSHVLYFVSFIVVSCFTLVICLFPTITADALSLEAQISVGLLRVLLVVQSFVLGPRMILSVREYHAQLTADPDAATGMTSIAFQERMHISTGSGV